MALNTGKQLESKVRRGINALFLVAMTTMPGYQGNIPEQQVSPLGIDAIIYEPPSQEMIESVKDRLRAQESHVITKEDGSKFLSLQISEREKDVFMAVLTGCPLNRLYAWYNSVFSENTKLTLEIPVSRIGDEYKPEIFRLEFKNHGLKPYPDSGNLGKYQKELKRKGNQGKQIEYYSRSGSSPILTDEKWDAIITQKVAEGEMVKVEDMGRYHVLGNIYQEQDPRLSEEVREANEERAKHVSKVSYDVLERIGRYINDQLHDIYELLDEATIMIPIGAVTRTLDYNDRMPEIMINEFEKKYPYATKAQRDKKGNVVACSSHIRGGAIDADLSFVVVCNKDGLCISFTEKEWPELVIAVRTLATQGLLTEVNEGNALGVLEPGNDVLHFIGVKPKAKNHLPNL